MSNKLIQSLSTEQNKRGLTAKGAKSNVSSLNACVDLFGQVGSMRGREDSQLVQVFSAAFGENPLKALKILFWLRDIRGGAGERRAFRVILRHLANSHTLAVEKNLNLIPEFGRWDDYFVLQGTPVWEDVVKAVTNQLLEDVDAKQPTLLAKWMPSINTSSEKSRKLARYFAARLGWSEKQYRQTLARLRGKIKIVEQLICSGEWDKVVYEHVPSRALALYRKAFRKHDEGRYDQYLRDVESGKKEIKAATLYPYDLLRQAFENKSDKSDKTTDLQWKALPNYVEPFNGMVVADVSGSMGSCGYHYYGRAGQIEPIYVAISLAMYIAERNTGPWKDHFMTFSTNPEFVQIKGSTLTERALNVNRANWDGTTDLQAAFELILETALRNKVSEEDMPKMLIIISDMQFNTACRSNKRTNFEQIEKRYKKAGYQRPQLVFWNVNAYGKDSPVTVDDVGTCLVSGCSPSILKSVLSQEILTPVDVMNATIESERYSVVTF